MRILEVNGTSLLGAKHIEAVHLLRTAGDEIQIIVCKGYDKSSLIHSIGSGGGMSTGFKNNSRLGSRASETGSELSQSVSSLDRDDDDVTTTQVQQHQVILCDVECRKSLDLIEFFFFFICSILKYLTKII